MKYTYTFLALLTIVVSACGLLQDEQAPASPTPVVVETPAPAPAPAPAPVVVAPEPFCPYETFYLFEVTERHAGLFQFSFRVVKDSQGRYLRRYQIQVYRSGSEFQMLEVEAKDTLGGPHGNTVFHEWRFPGTDPGTISARIRVHYPNECRDDGNGNVRANGPWSDIVGSAR